MPVRRMGSEGDAIAHPLCADRKYGRSDRGLQPRFRRCDDLCRQRQRRPGQALVPWPCPRQRENRGFAGWRIAGLGSFRSTTTSVIVRSIASRLSGRQRRGSAGPAHVRGAGRPQRGRPLLTHRGNQASRDPERGSKRGDLRTNREARPSPESDTTVSECGWCTLPAVRDSPLLSVGAKRRRT